MGNRRQGVWRFALIKIIKIIIDIGGNIVSTGRMAGITGRPTEIALPVIAINISVQAQAFPAVIIIVIGISLHAFDSDIIGGMDG